MARAAHRQGGAASAPLDAPKAEARGATPEIAVRRLVREPGSERGFARRMGVLGVALDQQNAELSIAELKRDRERALRLRREYEPVRPRGRVSNRHRESRPKGFGRSRCRREADDHPIGRR